MILILRHDQHASRSSLVAPGLTMAMIHPATKRAYQTELVLLFRISAMDSALLKLLNTRGPNS